MQVGGWRCGAPPRRRPGEVGVAEAGLDERLDPQQEAARGEVDPFLVFGGPDLPLTFAQTEYPVGGDTLLVAFGPREARLRADDTDGVAKALAIYRPELEVLEVSGHNWVSDPCSRETWPMLRPGQLRKLRELQTPEGRVHLAKSGYGTGWAGFIDGAIESGLRTAHRLLRRG